MQKERATNGENSNQTLYFSQDAHEKAKEPKGLLIIPGASHIDLYDKPEFVRPIVKKLAEFYGKNLYVLKFASLCLDVTAVYLLVQT